VFESIIVHNLVYASRNGIISVDIFVNLLVAIEASERASIYLSDSYDSVFGREYSPLVVLVVDLLTWKTFLLQFYNLIFQF
jgi:hypothetical protein